MMQDGGDGSGGVWVHEISARFPGDLIGLQLVGALKRYFAIPGYSLPATDAPQPAAQLQRLLRDLDRCRRESTALEVRMTLSGHFHSRFFVCVFLCFLRCSFVYILYLVKHVECGRHWRVPQGADVLWAINERLWYTAGFVGPCVEEAVPSRVLSVLETTSNKGQPQYLPAGMEQWLYEAMLQSGTWFTQQCRRCTNVSSSEFVRQLIAPYIFIQRPP